MPALGQVLHHLLERHEAVRAHDEQREPDGVLADAVAAVLVGVAGPRHLQTRAAEDARPHHGHPVGVADRALHDHRVPDAELHLLAARLDRPVLGSLHEHGVLEPLAPALPHAEPAVGARHHHHLDPARRHVAGDPPGGVGHPADDRLRIVSLQSARRGDPEQHRRPLDRLATRRLEDAHDQGGGAVEDDLHARAAGRRLDHGHGVAGCAGQQHDLVRRGGRVDGKGSVGIGLRERAAVEERERALAGDRRDPRAGEARAPGVDDPPRDHLPGEHPQDERRLRGALRGDDLAVERLVARGAHGQGEGPRIEGRELEPAPPVRRGLREGLGFTVEIGEELRQVSEHLDQGEMAGVHAHRGGRDAPAALVHHAPREGDPCAEPQRAERGRRAVAHRHAGQRATGQRSGLQAEVVVVARGHLRDAEAARLVRLGAQRHVLAAEPDPGQEDLGTLHGLVRGGGEHLAVHAAASDALRGRPPEQHRAGVRRLRALGGRAVGARLEAGARAVSVPGTAGDVVAPVRREAAAEQPDGEADAHEDRGEEHEETARHGFAPGAGRGEGTTSACGAPPRPSCSSSSPPRASRPPRCS